MANSPAEEIGESASRTPGAAGSAKADSAERPLDPLISNLAEIQEYLSNYIAAQKDGLIAVGRRTMIVAAAALSMGVVVLAFIAEATVLVLDGLAKGVATAAGGQLWIGEVAVGGGALIATVAASFFGTRYWLRQASKSTKRKYEQRHQAQRARFGRNEVERATG